jgi:AcrR family transcriptional regulator
LRFLCLLKSTNGRSIFRSVESAELTQAKRARSKGELTRQKVLERAFAWAGASGLPSLTIGELAADLGLSKSGLFAHFGSKEKLQLAVLEYAAGQFEQQVFRPALSHPRGLPRLVALFENWLDWIDGHERRGCVFLSAAIDFDDREGPVRDAIADWFGKADAMITLAMTLAQREGQLGCDADPAQLAFEFHGILLKYHLASRLSRRPDGRVRARAALRSLFSHHVTSPGVLSHVFPCS